MRLGLLLTLFTATVHAQRLEFEAISVHPHGNNTVYLAPTLRNGQFSSSSPLASAIALAYGFPLRLIVDGPEWLYSTARVYDLEGTVPSGVLPESLSGMVKTLLEDRLALKAHLERREIPVYTITVAEGGIKLLKTDEKSGLVGGIGRGVRGQATIADLLAYVQSWTDKPLVDRTGLSAIYSIETTPWLRAHGQSAGESTLPISDMPTFAQWLARMGLKMETSTGPVEVLVIDQIEAP